MEHAAATEEVIPFYQDPHFWVAVSFVLFVGVFIKYILPTVLSALDKRSADIARQLEQANKLRAEAEALLAASKLQQEEMQAEAALIIAHAERDAADIVSKAASDLAQLTARRLAQTDEKIARAQTNAAETIRHQIVDIATEAARQVIAQHLSTSKEDPAIAQALASIERQLH